MIEDHRRHLNELQADFERRCSGVLQRLWPGMEQTPDKMWPPIYVMRLEAEKQFEQWHRDNPVDEQKPGYKEIDLDRWQIKEVVDRQPPWRLKFIGTFKTIANYAEAPRALRIDPTFCPTPQRFSWKDYEELLKDNPNALNYPLLPEIPNDQSMNETWFLETCSDVKAKYKEVPDLSCQMLVKIMQLLLTCITTFQDVQHERSDWYKYDEPHQGLAFDLNELATEDQMWDFMRGSSIFPATSCGRGKK